jgi:hypothetical protein
MNWLTTLMRTLLQRSEPLLPAEYRAWACALRTESDEVPAGWDRLAWLSGGMWFTVREAALKRGAGYALAFAAAAAGIAWSAWSGPPGDSATEINRVDVIAISVILAGLPWVIRRAHGPVAGGPQARVIRTVGYVMILVLIFVKATVERVADAPPNNLEVARAWTGEIVFLAVMVGYAALILACTASRSPAAPATAGIGTAAGVVLGVLVYLIGPLGFPLRFAGVWSAHLYDAAMGAGVLLALCAPVAAAWAAGRAAGSMPARSRARQGAMAGLCTGAAAALVVSALSTATIALLPYDGGLRTWAVSHIGQWTPAVGQMTPYLGVRLGYVAGASAFAAGFLFVLALSPLGGWGLGAWAGRAGGRRGTLARTLRPAATGPGGAPMGGSTAAHLRSHRGDPRRAVRAPDNSRPVRPRRRRSDHHLARGPAGTGVVARRTWLPDPGGGAERRYRRRLPARRPAQPGGAGRGGGSGRRRG